LTVVYGKPIEVSDYHQLYSESPEKAFNELRERLSDEIKNLMVNIESVEDYEAIDELRNIINGKYSDDIKNPKLFRDRILIEKLNNLKISDPDKYNRICFLSLQVKRKASDLRISYRLLAKKKHPLGWLITGLAGLLVTLPVWLFGNIFTLNFLTIPDIKVRKIKDPQFQSTIRFGISFALALVILPLYLVICLLIFSPWWLAILVFLIIPVSGIFAWNYNLLFHRIIGGFRVRKLVRKRNKDYLKLKSDYDDLVNLVSLL
jgi:hypothetical protein